MLSSRVAFASRPHRNSGGERLNTIHHTAVIGDGVEMGSGNVIGPYAVLLGRVQLGDGNWIGPHVVIGTPAEMRGTDHGTDVGGAAGAGVEIGDGNVIREYTTIHQGHQAATRVGAGCFLMNKVYVAHDGAIGDNVTMASGATLGGHVHIGTLAHLGMGTLVHQRRVVGPVTMVGMGSVVTRDIPPFSLAYGNPCRVRSANRVGMQRAGIPEETIDALDKAYADGLPDAALRDASTAWAWSWWDESHVHTS
jgi:UDP-N-acetylglucosamine acyltransferase